MICFHPIGRSPRWLSWLHDRRDGCSAEAVPSTSLLCPSSGTTQPTLLALYLAFLSSLSTSSSAPTPAALQKMSGLEIVAGVAAIVSACNGSVTLFRSWRDKRRERLGKTQNRNLETSLTVGGTTVQREYDGHFARLGREFAVGDGELF